MGGNSMIVLTVASLAMLNSLIVRQSIIQDFYLHGMNVLPIFSWKSGCMPLHFRGNRSTRFHSMPISSVNNINVETCVIVTGDTIGSTKGKRSGGVSCNTSYWFSNRPIEAQITRFHNAGLNASYPRYAKVLSQIRTDIILLASPLHSQMFTLRCHAIAMHPWIDHQ
jgi:hypothetical protein